MTTLLALPDSILQKIMLYLHFATAILFKAVNKAAHAVFRPYIPSVFRHLSDQAFVRLCKVKDFMAKAKAIMGCTEIALVGKDVIDIAWGRNIKYPIQFNINKPAETHPMKIYRERFAALMDCQVAARMYLRMARETYIHDWNAQLPFENWARNARLAIITNKCIIIDCIQPWNTFTMFTFVITTLRVKDESRFDGKSLEIY